ncbi:MAG TPA: formyltetrahydrofolate deformylase [Niabella sp.]|nr:formyltetrahydrofolate deformylase [Niabella sp.]
MIILLQCSDRVGLVADISAIMAAANLNIISMKEYVNVDENRFYIRLEIQGSTDLDLLQQKIKAKLPEDTEISIRPYEKKKIAVLVTREHHCLGDILLRNFFNTLGADVQCVIGNYDTLQALTEKFDIPFHYISHEGKEKHVFEQEIISILKRYEFDYIVLAKFMRILSPEFISHYPSAIINIHHSFLPAFIGAHPYKQAHERGVKLIGATAHFVTNVLDDGPIIAQQTIPVNHAHTVKDMVRLGREIEKSVLANALQLVLQDKVLLYHNKTIVFEN